MAEQKISQLTPYPASGANDSDVMAIVDMVSGETKKISLFELDTRWKGVPSGGSTGQVLAKASNTDGDTLWRTLDKNSFGLGQVNNTADIDKPISTQMASALAQKANQSTVNAKADTTYVNDQLLLKENKLPVGTDGQILSLLSGLPVWVDASTNELIVGLGNPTSDNSWRLRVDGLQFKIEVRDTGIWVTRLTIDKTIG